MGSCVLKGSVVECWSIALMWHFHPYLVNRWSSSSSSSSSINNIDCWSWPVSVGTYESVDTLPTIDQWSGLSEVSIKCQFSVERVSNDILIKMSAECWSKIYIDIQLRMPLVVMIQGMSGTMIFVTWSRQSFTCICRFQMTIKVILWRCSAYQDTMRRTWSLFWYQRDLSMTGKQSLQKWRMIGRLKNLVTICNMHDTLYIGLDLS